MSQLPIAAKKASDIAESASNLATQLKEMSFDQSSNVQHGVDPFIFAVTIFILACFVGYYVVWKVTPALHTPLMSITNAISGIVIIASLVAGASEYFSASSVLGFIGVFFASINIFGGFIVTERMLEMFKKKTEK